MSRAPLRPLLAAALLALAAALPARAQRAAPPLGGITGGAMGLIGGGAAGCFLETAVFRCQGTEFCGLGGLLLGAAMGEVAMLPYGVHQANRSRGRYAPALATSIVVGVVGLAAASQSGEAASTVLFATPAVQLLAAIAVERETERERRQD